MCHLASVFKTHTLKIIQIKSLSKLTWDSAETLCHNGLWEKVGLRESVYRFKLSSFCFLHWWGKERRVGGGISCCLGVWKKAGSLLRMAIYQLRKKKVKSMQKESVPFSFHWNCKYVAFLLYFSFKWYSCLNLCWRLNILEFHCSEHWKLGLMKGFEVKGSRHKLGEKSFPYQEVTLIRSKMLLGILCPKQLPCHISDIVTHIHVFSW